MSPRIIPSKRFLRPQFLPTSLQKQSVTCRRVHTPPSQNRMYQPVRNQEDFNSILLTTTGNNIPLITLWTTSYCPTCNTVAPLIRDLLENPNGGGRGDWTHLSKDCRVAYAEIQMDAPEMGGLGGQYIIRSVPMLLSFRRGLPQYDKALTSKSDLTNREHLVNWIENVSKEGEEDRKNISGGLFGRLFGR